MYFYELVYREKMQWKDVTFLIKLSQPTFKRDNDNTSEMVYEPSRL